MNLDFIRQLVFYPREIGSLVPSSKYLAREMVKFAQNNANENTTFLEVGPGTGVITKYLLESVQGTQKIIVLEKNINFYNKLVSKFPNTQIVHGCVSNIDEIIKKNNLTSDVVIISSLPWISFSADDKKSCLEAVRGALVECSRSCMLQYTYSNKPPIEINELKSRKLATIYRNFPPASIWKYANEV